KLNSDMASRVDTSANNALFKVIDPAHLPLRPVWPNRPAFLAIACLLGLGTGLGVGFLREFSDSTLRDEDEVSSRLKLPVLASVPLVVPSSPEKRIAAGKPKLSLIPSLSETNQSGFTLHTADSKVRHVIFGSGNMAGEQYRVVQASLAM